MSEKNQHTHPYDNDNNGTDVADLGESELLRRLALLPAPEFEPTISARIQKRARAAFLRHAESAKHPASAIVDRLARWYGLIEPVMVAGVAASYLFWGFTSAMALYR